MRNSVGRLILFISLVGCTPYLPDEVKHYPVGVNAVVLDETTVLSFSDSLVFESQFSFLDLAGHYDIGDISLGDFTFISPGHYAILDFRQSRLEGDPNLELMILEDESGNYDTLDPHNFRSKMVNKLCQDLHASGSFVVGGFSRQGIIQAPVEFSSTGFTTDWMAQQNFIFSLAQRTGGQSSLYDALSQALGKFSRTSGHAKGIVVLAHEGDLGSASTLADVISQANSSQVKIHVLFLGTGEQAGAIPQLSSLTGGMFAILPTDKEMITVFNHFYRLLAGDRYVYTLRVSYKPESGIFSFPDITHAVSVKDYTDGKNYNPLSIYTKIP